MTPLTQARISLVRKYLANKAAFPDGLDWPNWKEPHERALVHRPRKNTGTTFVKAQDAKDAAKTVTKNQISPLR